MKNVTQDNLIEILNGMTGNTYNYLGNSHKVLGVSIDAETKTFVITTNHAELTRKFSVASALLQYFELEKIGDQVLPATLSVNKPQEIEMPAFFKTDAATADTLVAKLMANIEKVENDPSYIPQADSILKNVDGVMAIQRMKIDMFKVLKGK